MLRPIRECNLTSPDVQTAIARRWIALDLKRGAYLQAVGRKTSNWERDCPKNVYELALPLVSLTERGLFGAAKENLSHRFGAWDETYAIRIANFRLRQWTRSRTVDGRKARSVYDAARGPASRPTTLYEKVRKKMLDSEKKTDV